MLVLLLGILSTGIIGIYTGTAFFDWFGAMGTGTVSYTHLDVYKRQSPVFGSDLILREEFGTHTYAEHTRLNPRCV